MASSKSNQHKPKAAATPSKRAVATQKVTKKTASESPATWPGAFGVFNQSQKAVILNVSALIALYALAIIVSVICYFLGKLGDLLSNLFSVVLTGATTYVYIAGVRKKQTQFEEALSKGVSVFVKMFIVSLLTVLALVGSILLFVIPFFFVLPRLFLVNYFLIDQNLGPVEAIKASWNATEGHSMKVWGIIGASIVMILPAFTIIGIPVAIYLIFVYAAASAILYEFIRDNEA